MKRLRKSAFRAAMPMVLLVAAACGGELAPIQADLIAPEVSEAKLTLTPALEVSSFAEGLAERMFIEDIQMNLGDVRLLGADPRLPVGGLMLLEQNRVVKALGDRPAIDLPFPAEFLDDDDLAVFVRIDRTPQLDGASVIVRVRVYQQAVQGGASSLTVQTSEATDPDGDPASDPEAGADIDATDPDGDPALPGDCEDATDPDGDPARPACQRDELVQRGVVQPYVTVELRDERASDLVATLDDPGATDVVVGIPASRWFTPEVVAELDAALAEVVKDTLESQTPFRDASETIIVESNPKHSSGPGRRDGAPADDYFLSDKENIERLTVRRGR